MRGPFCLVIVQTGRDRYRLYLEGYEDGATLSAANPRYSPIASQPRDGFGSREAAHAHFLDLLSEARRDEYDEEEAAAQLRRGIRIHETRVLRSSDLVRSLRPGAAALAAGSGD